MLEGCRGCSLLPILRPASHAHPLSTTNARSAPCHAPARVFFALQRKKLPTEGLTPVTADSFAKWKEARAARRAVELEARRVEEAKRTGTKGYNVLSGRALFAYDPSLFIDDDAAGDAAVYEEREEEGAADGAPAGNAGGDAAAGAGGVIDESLFAGDDADLDDLPDEDEDGEEEEEEGEEEEEEAEGGAGAP